MNDPSRLVDAGGTEFERLLLRAAAEEEPSSDVSARMLAGVLSAGAAVAMLPCVTASSSAVSGSGAAAASVAPAGLGAASLAGAGGSLAPPATAAWAGAWLVKWGVIGVLATGVAVTGVVTAGSTGSGGEPSQAGTPRAVSAGAGLAADRAPQVAPATGPDAATPAVALSAEPATQRGIPSPAGGPTEVPLRTLPARPAPGAAHALAPEIELLDSARRALGDGDAERALALIAGYHRRFPTGALSQEATVLEVDALEAKGRAAQATDLKQQFLAEHPESAHTERVKRSGQAR